MKAHGSSPLLEVRDLSVVFGRGDRALPAVRGATFDVPRGRTVALLGESGCGKSVTARSVLGLVDAPGRIAGGEILFRPDPDPDVEALDLLAMRAEGDAIRAVRWAQISMIFQNPRAALTPAWTVGEQIAEALRHHRKLTKSEARRRAVALLQEVGIPGAERRLNDYPHQMSGGMCQRVMIAMALACEPRLIVADEPTTALDVTIQSQVLRLLKRAQTERGASVLLITHDLGVVAEVADQVAVMYLGAVVERGPVSAVFDRPKHPYTRGLFASRPTADLARDCPLPTIPGSVPDPRRAPEGCAFRGRCGDETEWCRQRPAMREVEPGHWVACWLHEAAGVGAPGASEGSVGAVL